MKPTLSIVIVNWNTASHLRRCLRSLEKHVLVNYEAVIVDNASEDESVAMVRHLFPDMRLLPQSTNLGFSRGSNLGLTVARGDYLMLLNPDTEVCPGALETIIEFLESNPRAGMATPTLLNPDGTYQVAMGPFPTLWNEFLQQTMLFRVTHKWARRNAFSDKPTRAGRLSGAALCVRRACYEEIGPLDPNIFMFYEDTDWCMRAADAGWERWFVPCSGVVHEKAAASSRFARTRTLLDSHRSAIYYFRKHHGEETITYLRLITLLGAFMRGTRAIVLWMLRRNPPDQQARLKAYGRMFWWGLTGRGLRTLSQEGKE